MRASVIATVALLVAAFAAGVYLAVTRSGSGDAPDVAGLLWPDPPVLTSFRLDRAGGGTVTEDDLRGRWTFVFFGFTNCPDVCPTTMNTLRQVNEILRGDATTTAPPQVLFVSVDPERDEPEALRAYVDYFNPEFVAATADNERLGNFARQFGVLYMKIATGAEGSYTMDHSASILLVDPDLRFLAIFSQPHEPADVAQRYSRIAAFAEQAR